MDYNKLYILTFQLTTSQGGRQEHTIFHHGPEVFQLTTSQGGRPMALYILNSNSAISTHDLTRRSTTFLSKQRIPLHISTHDLTRRSTFCSSVFPDWAETFQLTTSQGGRPM